MGEFVLPGKAGKIIYNFVEKLKSIYGGNLVSAVLYGSAASGEYTGKYSNINLAVVLKNASISSVGKSACILQSGKFSAINPVFFTEDYIKKSLDVFPIEFLDMKENHRVLCGSDPFKDINVDLKHLRFQCEQEIKSKIINIKKMYVRNKSRLALNNILFKSLTSSIHILRNLLRLKGKVPSYKKEDVLNEISAEFGVGAGALKKMLDAKNGNVKLGLAETEVYLEDLVEFLEKLSDKVDGL